MSCRDLMSHHTGTLKFPLCEKHINAFMVIFERCVLYRVIRMQERVCEGVVSTLQTPTWPPGSPLCSEAGRPGRSNSYSCRQRLSYRGQQRHSPQQHPCPSGAAESESAVSIQHVFP